jgi:hypothetical protein
MEILLVNNLSHPPDRSQIRERNHRKNPCKIPPEKISKKFGITPLSHLLCSSKFFKSSHESK